jgi:hypothetical protein
MPSKFSWEWRVVGLWVWLIAWFGACLTQAASPDRPALDYVIVVTGGEVLEGLFPDSHTHFLTRTLRSLGGRCLGSVTVDDREQDLNGALHLARRRS